MENPMILSYPFALFSHHLDESQVPRIKEVQINIQKQDLESTEGC